MKPLLLLVPCLVLLIACANPSGGRLSYANVQALNPGVPADWVLSEFPFGRASRRPDDTVQSIQYSVQDPRGRGQTLTLHFDGREILTRKTYSGQVERPGGAQGGPSTR